MKTDKYSIIFVEVPYIQNEWLQKAPPLSEAIDSWYTKHQLSWIKMRLIFEYKGSQLLVKRRITGLNGVLEDTFKERLSQFAFYKGEFLLPIISVQNSFVKVIEQSSSSVSSEKRRLSGYNYATRLRRLKRRGVR